MKRIIKKINYRLSLVDVMYGVILTYGFATVDQVKGFEIIPVLKYIFAYSIIIIDWVHAHEVYSREGYSSNIIFILDLIILFIISRLIKSSVSSSQFSFWIFMGALFFLYSTWDFLMLKINKKSEFNFINELKADLFNCLICLVFVLTIHFKFIRDEIFLFLIFAVMYIITVIIWERRIKKT